jgi:hypothetical protein
MVPFGKMPDTGVIKLSPGISVMIRTFNDDHSFLWREGIVVAVCVVGGSFTCHTNLRQKQPSTEAQILLGYGGTRVPHVAADTVLTIRAR